MRIAALPRLVLVSGGLIVWSLCFVLLYSLLSVGCMAGTEGLSLWLAALWLAHVAVLAGALFLLVRHRRDAADTGVRPFLIRLGCQLTLIGGFATVWIGLPSIFRLEWVPVHKAAHVRARW